MYMVIDMLLKWYILEFDENSSIFIRYSIYNFSDWKPKLK